MFRDREQELKRLEEQLLEEDEQELPETEEDDTDALLEALYEGPTLTDKQFYNGDRVDVDPRVLSDALEQPRERLTGLVIAALLLTTGILAILAWWAYRLLG